MPFKTLKPTNYIISLKSVWPHANSLTPLPSVSLFILWHKNSTYLMFKWDNILAILASDPSTWCLEVLILYMTWLTSKSKPLHSYSLLLLITVPSQYWCVSTTHLHDVLLLDNSSISFLLSPESMARTSSILWSSQVNHRARSRWRPAFLCFFDRTSPFLHTFPITSFERHVWPSTFPPSGYELDLINSSHFLKTFT